MLYEGSEIAVSDEGLSISREKWQLNHFKRVRSQKKIGWDLKRWNLVGPISRLYVVGDPNFNQSSIKSTLKRRTLEGSKFSKEGSRRTRPGNKIWCLKGRRSIRIYPFSFRYVTLNQRAREWKRSNYAYSPKRGRETFINSKWSRKERFWAKQERPWAWSHRGSFAPCWSQDRFREIWSRRELNLNFGYFLPKFHLWSKLQRQEF